LYKAFDTFISCFFFLCKNNFYVMFLSLIFFPLDKVRIKNDNDTISIMCLVFRHHFHQAVPGLFKINLLQSFEFFPSPNHIISVDYDYNHDYSPNGCLFRKTSYKSILHATDALRDDSLPFIGRLTVQSHFSFTRRLIPFPPLPITIAFGNVPPNDRYSSSPDASRPTTLPFRSVSASIL